SDLVRTGLTGSHDISFDFRFYFLVPDPGLLAHVRDRLFARPMLSMNSSIDNQSHCAERLIAQSSQIAERIVVIPSRLLGQPFAVKGPAFYVGGERNDLSKLRKAFEFFYC